MSNDVSGYSALFLVAALCILTLITTVENKYSDYVQSFTSFTCADNSVTDNPSRRSLSLLCLTYTHAVDEDCLMELAEKVFLVFALV